MFFSGLQWTKNTKKTPYQQGMKVRRTILYQTFLVSFSKRAAFFCGIFLYYIIPPASAQFFTCYFFIFGWKIQLARYAKINAADVPTAPAFNPPWNNPKNPLSFTASFTP